MIKIISVVVLISLNLYAQNFDEFLNNALKNSPYLRSSNLSINQAKLEGDIQTRYENPNLELQYSNFNPNTAKSENGYRIAAMQPIRLWGVSSDKEKFSSSLKNKAKAQLTLSKAELTQKISLLFVEYAQKIKLSNLSKEELEIAKRIYEISQARYDAGTISKGIMLQAKVDYEMVDINLYSLKYASQEQYFELLKVAGLSKEIELNYTNIFSLNDSLSLQNNPELILLDADMKKNFSYSKVQSNSVEYIDFLAEYENEPDQDIYRVGVSIPLAIFNTKSQETQIAKLEADKIALITDMQTSRLNMQTLQLNKQRKLLKKLEEKSEITLRTQENLLFMFEDSYKIASVNLLELQNIKNKVIETKELLINIKSNLDRNTIITNYIAGAYNE